MLNSVMIVDDIEADRYIARWSLEKNSLASHILEARDGQEALDSFLNYEESRKKYGDKFPPTLILLDINMPRMGGFEFLEEFSKVRKEHNEYFDSVVIMMFTSSELLQDRDRAMSYDFVRGYLTKPVSAEDLSEVLGREFD